MDAIMSYLINNLEQSKFIAENNYNKICKYEDIKNEFMLCIDNNEIPENGIVVEGYSASDIHLLAPFMNFLGVYNFLIALREKPETAKSIIVDKFQIK